MRDGGREVEAEAATLDEIWLFDVVRRRRIRG
jgi:hypothetical protein